MRKAGFSLSQREVDPLTGIDATHTFVSSGTTLGKTPRFHGPTSQKLVEFFHTPSVYDPMKIFRVPKILIIIGLHKENQNLRYNIENCLVMSYASIIDLIQNLNSLIIILVGDIHITHIYIYI